MSINERPGVYSSYEVSSAITGSASGLTVGVAAVSAKGETAKCCAISSYAEAVAIFGADCNMTELIRLLFLNGAYTVKAVPAVVSVRADADDYELAFKVLKKDEEVRILVCDSDDEEVHGVMLSSINTTTENCKFRIGIVEAASTTIAGTAAKAAKLNSERMVITAPVLERGDALAYVPGSAAAALAGAVAASRDPALPFNGAELAGLPGTFKQFTDDEITTLVRGGVTPLESAGGRNLVVRGVTTRTKTGAAPDSTWRELTTTLIVDDVITTIKNSLSSRFSRTKNTRRTRGAIRTQVVIELENKLQKEIIDSYSGVSAEPSSDDPTICEVSFDFTVAHGLNQIYLTAHITV